MLSTSRDGILNVWNLLKLKKHKKLPVFDRVENSIMHLVVSENYAVTISNFEYEKKN